MAKKSKAKAVKKKCACSCNCGNLILWAIAAISIIFGVIVARSILVNFAEAKIYYGWVAIFGTILNQHLLLGIALIVILLHKKK